MFQKEKGTLNFLFKSIIKRAKYFNLTKNNKNNNNLAVVSKFSGSAMDSQQKVKFGDMYPGASSLYTASLMQHVTSRGRPTYNRVTKIF